MIIGIDLGTNNVCISYYHNNKLIIIKDNQDNSFIKSLIAINNSIVVTGNDVLNINDKEWIVIRNLKRLIGMSTENIIVHEKEYSIVELTSFLLSKIKNVSIPMLGNCESLNLAMSVTICVFEMVRQRCI